MKKEHTKKKKQETKEYKRADYALIILMGFILLFSVVQAVQIDDMKESVTLSSLKTSVYGNSLGNQQPAGAPQAAPTMVGGC